MRITKLQSLLQCVSLLSCSLYSAFGFSPSFGKCPVYVKSSSLMSSSSTYEVEKELLGKIQEGIQEAGYGEEWEKSIHLLNEFTTMDAVEAELLLSKALEWRAWAMAPSPTMRKYIKTTEPNSETLKKSLEWLTTSGPLKLSTEELGASVSAHPQAFLLDPASQFEKVRNSAPEKYSSTESLVSLLKDTPSSFQNTYNCATADEGCAGNCGSCWVTYSKK